MIVHEKEVNKKELLTLAYEQLGKNYFILLGLSISKMIYSDLYYLYHENGTGKELEALVLKRRSCNLQLICCKDTCSPDVIKDFHQVIQQLDYKKLITSRQNIEALQGKTLFDHVQEGAFISETSHPILLDKSLPVDFNLRDLNSNDMNAIVTLYKMVFESFTPPKVIQNKLNTGRGRAVGLFHNDKLVAVAQTDFETKNAAIIVGVATHPDYQQQGFGHFIMSALCRPLMAEGKKMILHYDSPVAGRLYDKIGFVKVDRVCHYG